MADPGYRAGVYAALYAAAASGASQTHVPIMRLLDCANCGHGDHSGRSCLSRTDGRTAPEWPRRGPIPECGCTSYNPPWKETP